MGVNNRQRRAAKKKARARKGQRSPWAADERVAPAALTAEDVRELLLDVVAQIHDDRTAAERCARLLLQPGWPLTADMARAGVRSLLADLVRTVTSHGWSPSDIAEVTRRLATSAHVPYAVGLLEERASRYEQSRLPVAWRDDLRGAGKAAALQLDNPPGMQLALELAATLAQLPAIPAVVPAPGTDDPKATATPADAKVLARVQALLAKAEATEFDEEAEALSAKAQELVSRHALEQLLASAGDGEDFRPVVRRLWLENPYVVPKAMLVDVVADANRCRSVVTEAFGFCTLVGAPADLAAVEVLVPSLLVQAHAAMSRFGRQADRRGTSRTRSFRQSFLLAYAGRIGERLRAADDEVRTRTGRSGELLPVLARHRGQVDAVCDELFPHVTSKARSPSNALGWAAGRAAADEALFGADLQVTAAAS
jgi:hypothetical protein